MIDLLTHVFISLAAPLVPACFAAGAVGKWREKRHPSDGIGGGLAAIAAFLVVYFGCALPLLIWG